MDALELQALRKSLGVTARDLAGAIGVDQETMLAWERGELFPTKKHVDALLKLREAGPGAVPKRPKKGATPMAVLGDPAMWTLVRKVLAHEALRREVMKAADKYADPLDQEG